jgi:hypothetical protein
MRYNRKNIPQFPLAQNILQNQHEYGTMNNIMTIHKPLNNNTMLIPYDQYSIQSLHQEGKLIAKQHPREPNLLFQLAIDPPCTPREITSESISPTSNT